VTNTLPTTDRSRWLALVVLCAGMLMIVLDATIVNVALPSIQRDLGFSQSGLAWVVNAYLIPFGGLLLLAGRLGDLVGRKRVFLAGLAVFTVASLLCGLSGSRELLVGARLLQGVGGAMTSTVILGVIVTMFPEAREQARAIGVFSFTAAAGGSVGLLAGGVLTQAVSWHWIFFVNLPIGVAAAVLAQRLIARDPGIGLRRGADVPGALLVTSALMLGVYAIVQARDAGWTSAPTLGLGAAAVLLMAGFFVRQALAANPLLPLGLFRSRSVSGANVVQMLMVAGIFGMFFLGALYLQRVLGYDPLQIGLAFLPVAVAIGALSFRLSAELNTRFGARTMLLVGLALILAGLLLFARAPLEARYPVDILPAMVLLGIGGLSGDHDAGHVRRHGLRLRSRLRPRQHDRAGGRVARPGGAGDAGHLPHRPPARHRSGRRRRPDGRLPPGVRRRGRAGRGRARRRGGRPAARRAGRSRERR